QERRSGDAAVSVRLRDGRGPGQGKVDRVGHQPANTGDDITRRRGHYAKSARMSAVNVCDEAAVKVIFHDWNEPVARLPMKSNTSAVSPVMTVMLTCSALMALVSAAPVPTCKVARKVSPVVRVPKVLT